jgi:capsular exopolysaccharide synthesis family protein
MIEKPSLTHDPVSGSSSVPVANGRAEERSLGAVPGSQGASASRAKPHFAVTPAKMLGAFFYRWKLALLVGLIFASVGVGVAWFTYKPKFTAIAMIRMMASRPPVIPGDQQYVVAITEEFQKTQSHLVKSRDVLSTVVERDEIRNLKTISESKNPTAWLYSQVQAFFIPSTDIMNVYVSGDNPEEITLIVNAVTDVYVDQIRSGEKQGAVDQLSEIEKLTLALEERVRQRRAELGNLAKALKTANTKVLELKQRMAWEDYNRAKGELSNIESEIRKAKAAIAIHRAGLQGAETEKVAAETIDEYLESHPAVLAQQQEIAHIEGKIKEDKKYFKAGTPRMRELTQELNSAKAKLNKTRLAVQPEVLKKIQKDSYRVRLTSVGQAEGLLLILNEQQAIVQKAALDLQDAADKLGISSFEVETKRADVEDAEGSLKKARGLKERLEIEKFNTSTTIIGHQRAEIPTVNEASLIKTSSIYGLIGLLLGCLVVSYFESRLHRVQQPAEVQRDLGIKTLGVLPFLSSNLSGAYGRAEPANESLPGIVFTDAVDSLCASLLCDDRLSRNAVLMVTSAGEDEGKTLLATQLAAGFARSGRRTLFLDCDFRNSRCQQDLGLPAGPGLSEVLRGEIELAGALQALPNSEIRILTAGRCCSEVTKALSNGKLAALLARLRQDFDSIIIDSAPTPVVADGLLIGRLADGVILVVRSKVSKGPAVVAAYEQLAALKIPILGAVVNANPARASSAYYAS